MVLSQTYRKEPMLPFLVVYFSLKVGLKVEGGVAPTTWIYISSCSGSRGPETDTGTGVNVFRLLKMQRGN